MAMVAPMGMHKGQPMHLMQASLDGGHVMLCQAPHGTAFAQAGPQNGGGAASMPFVLLDYSGGAAAAAAAGQMGVQLQYGQGPALMATHGSTSHHPHALPAMGMAQHPHSGQGYVHAHQGHAVMADGSQLLLHHHQAQGLLQLARPASGAPGMPQHGQLMSLRLA